MREFEAFKEARAECMFQREAKVVAVGSSMLVDIPHFPLLSTFPQLNQLQRLVACKEN